LRQFLQQRLAAFGLRGEQGGPGQIDDSGDACRNLARARFLFGQGEQAEPGGEAEDQQAANQHDRARQQRVRKVGHQSGTKT